MRLTIALSIALGVSAAACGSPSGPSGSGNLRLMITDAPFEDATAVHVTFSEVKAHRDDGEGGWITVPFAGTPAATTRTCNLKGEVKLNRPFELMSNSTTTIELDFDGPRSINQTGNGTYKMSPVIGIKTVNTQ